MDSEEIERRLQERLQEMRRKGGRARWAKPEYQTEEYRAAFGEAVAEGKRLAKKRKKK